MDKGDVGFLISFGGFVLMYLILVIISGGKKGLDCSAG